MRTPNTGARTRFIRGTLRVTVPLVIVSASSSESGTSSRVYSPVSETERLNLPASSVVSVSSKPLGPVTWTSAPAITPVSLRTVEVMQELSCDGRHRLAAADARDGCTAATAASVMIARKNAASDLGDRHPPHHCSGFHAFLLKPPWAVTGRAV